MKNGLSPLSKAINSLDWNLSSEEPLLKLLTLTCGQEGIPPNGLDGEKSLSWLRDVTQRHFLRKPGSERWELEEPLAYVTNRELLLSLLTELGFCAEAIPPPKVFGHILILSSIAGKFRERLEYLGPLFSEGIGAKTIYLVGGSRKLHSKLEAEYSAKLGESATELEMLIDMFKQFQMEEKIPSSIPFVPIDTPYQADEQGKVRRPNTADTIFSWLEHKPQPDSILVISCQPYVRYQRAIVESIVPAEYSIFAGGPMVRKNEKISVMLDTLARFIFASYPRAEQKLKLGP